MKNLKRYLALFMALTLLVVATAACGGGSGTDTSKPAGDTDKPAVDVTDETTFGLAPFEEKQTLRIGYFGGSPLSLPFYIAEQEGFFEELNIDVVFETFTNGPAMMEANADWDIAGCGLGGLLTGMVGYDVKVIGVSDYEENMALFVKPDSELAKNPDDAEVWKGTTWLYPMGTTGQAVLAAALEERGLSLNDVNSINMDVASALTGFKSEGDGLAVWNLIAFAAEDAGNVRLTDAGQMGLTFPCATLVTDKFLESDLDLASYAYAVFYKTWEWCQESDENLQKAADYYLENSLDEGLAATEDIATRVIEWYRAPNFDESVKIMTDTAPDNAGIYTTRDLLQAENDIMEGMDFFISEEKYTKEDRDMILDENLVDSSVALRAKEILEAQ